jgi:hypothetical protein
MFVYYHKKRTRWRAILIHLRGGAQRESNWRKISISAVSNLNALRGAQVLAIAQADAVKAYGDLSAYRISLVLEDDGWHVDYELKNPRYKGGGPHYVIDATSGSILQKRYDQ